MEQKIKSDMMELLSHIDMDKIPGAAEATQEYLDEMILLKIDEDEDIFTESDIKMIKFANNISTLVPFKSNLENTGSISSIFESVEKQKLYESKNKIFQNTITSIIENEISKYDEGRLNNEKVFTKFSNQLEKNIIKSLSENSNLNEMLIESINNQEMLTENLTNEGIGDLFNKAKDAVSGAFNKSMETDRELSPEDKQKRDLLIDELKMLTVQIKKQDKLKARYVSMKDSDNNYEKEYALAVNTLNSLKTEYNEKSKEVTDIDTTTRGFLANLTNDLKKNLSAVKQAVVDVGSFVSGLTVENIIERLAASWKWTVGMFKLIAQNLQNGWNDIVVAFKDEGFMGALKELGNKIKGMVIAGASKMAAKMAAVQDTMFAPFKKLFLVKGWDRKIAGLDKFITSLESGKPVDFFGTQISPKLAKGISIAISGLKIIAGYYLAKMAYHIWTKMFFIGDPKYDFDFSAVALTMAGQYQLADWFSSSFGPTLFWYYLGLNHSDTFDGECPPQCPWLGNEFPFGEEFNILGEQISGNHVLMALITLIIILFNSDLSEKFNNIIEAIRKTARNSFSFLFATNEKQKAIVGVASSGSGAFMKPGSGKMKI